MKVKITRWDATVIEAEGTPAELREFCAEATPAIPAQFKPLWTPPMVTQPAPSSFSELINLQDACYPCNGRPWLGTTSPSCTCGRNLQDIPNTFTSGYITFAADSITTF